MLKNGTKYVPSTSIGNIYTPYKVYGHFNSFDKKVIYNFVLRAYFHYNDVNGCVVNQEKYFTLNATSVEKAIKELKNNLLYYLNIGILSCFKINNINPKIDQFSAILKLTLTKTLEQKGLNYGYCCF